MAAPESAAPFRNLRRPGIDFPASLVFLIVMSSASSVFFSNAIVFAQGVVGLVYSHDLEVKSARQKNKTSGAFDLGLSLCGPDGTGGR
jgi:hypothetical protein